MAQSSTRVLSADGHGVRLSYTHRLRIIVRGAMAFFTAPATTTVLAVLLVLARQNLSVGYRPLTAAETDRAQYRPGDRDQTVRLFAAARGRGLVQASRACRATHNLRSTLVGTKPAEKK